MSDNINGQCAVIVNPDGHIVAEATDFDTGYAAGIPLEEQQQYRVRNRVMRAFAKSHLNRWLAENIDDYFANRFFEHAQTCGYKIHIFHIGSTHD